jgi:hypothetical protein
MTKVRTVILTEEHVPLTAIYCCHLVLLPVTAYYSDCHVMTELLG